MKNTIKNRLIGAVLLMLSAIVLSCGSQEDSFEEFAALGEIIAVGKADTVVANSGIEKMRVWVAINADPKVKKGKLRSVNGEIEHDFDIVRNKDGQDTVVFDIDIPEGEYAMLLELFNAEGKDKSLAREFTVKILGPNYMGALANRTASVAFDTSNETAVITWGNVETHMKVSTLTYVTNDGSEKQIAIANDDTQTVIDDFKAGGTFEVVSTYSPPNTIEDFVATTAREVSFPLCNKAAVLTISETVLDFGEVNNGETADKSFTVQSMDCLASDVSLTLGASDYFSISTSMTGPFESSLSLEDVSTEQTIYVRFEANSGNNVSFSTDLTLSAGNFESSYTVSLTATESGNPISGIQPHPVAWRSWAGDVFTDDIAITAFGTKVENLWDDSDSWPSVIHSDATQIPQGFFTIDLGADWKLTEISWNGRADCCQDRSPKRYQYWGLPADVDPSSAVTTTELIGKPENVEAWSKESLSKGWIPLGDFTLDENTSDLKVDKINTPFEVRYVRMVVIDSFGGNYLSIATLDFKVDYGD